MNLARAVGLTQRRKDAESQSRNRKRQRRTEEYTEYAERRLSSNPFSAYSAVPVPAGKSSQAANMFGYCSAETRLECAKGLECAELAPAVWGSRAGRKRQQAGRTPNALPHKSSG